MLVVIVKTLNIRDELYIGDTFCVFYVGACDKWVHIVSSSIHLCTVYFKVKAIQCESLQLSDVSATDLVLTCFVTT